MSLNRNFFALAGAFVGLLTAALSVLLLVFLEGVGPTPGFVAATGVVFAALLLFWVARRDLDAVLALLAVCALMTAGFTGLYLYFHPSAGWTPAAAMIGAALLGLFLGSATIRRRDSGSAEFPDVLGHRFGLRTLLETEGIQFTGTLTPGDDDAPHLITIYLQNTYDGPRRVTVEFDAAGYAQYLRISPRSVVQLGPAEVSSVTLPAVSHPKGGRYPLYFSLRVEGSDGRRVRYRRAQTATTRVTPGMTAALLVVGHVAYGGGVSLTIDPLPADLWEAELPSPVVTPLWLPGVGTLSYELEEED